MISFPKLRMGCALSNPFNYNYTSLCVWGRRRSYMAKRQARPPRAVLIELTYHCRWQLRKSINPDTKPTVKQFSSLSPTNSFHNCQYLAYESLVDAARPSRRALITLSQPSYARGNPKAPAIACRSSCHSLTSGGQL